jgi:hypothetical protein
MTYLRTKNMNLVLLPVLILLSAAGGYSSLKIAINTRNSLSPTLAKRAAAVANIPWSAEYQSHLADLRRSSGLPFTANLLAAVGNSPDDSRLWVELGLAQEQDGISRVLNAVCYAPVRLVKTTTLVGR